MWSELMFEYQYYTNDFCCIIRKPSGSVKNYSWSIINVHKKDEQYSGTIENETRINAVKYIVLGNLHCIIENHIRKLEEGKVGVEIAMREL